MNLSIIQRYNFLQFQISLQAGTSNIHRIFVLMSFGVISETLCVSLVPQIKKMNLEEM